MGLFTNNKKPCPICGEATPRLLATVIKDNIPICSSCAAKVSLVNTKVRALSVEGLKDHLVKREKNAEYLKETFRPNKKTTVGWTSLNIDDLNQVFTIPLNMCGDTKNPPVFKFEELISYELMEDLFVIERFNRGDIAPQFTPVPYMPKIFVNVGEKEEKEKETISRNFKIILHLSNSCWDKLEIGAGSASGTELMFQREYNRCLGELHMVTASLAGIIGIGGAAGSGNGAASGNAGSVAEDLKKFKELLDGGVITQEEFDAKKKQLLKI